MSDSCHRLWPVFESTYVPPQAVVIHYPNSDYGDVKMRLSGRYLARYSHRIAISDQRIIRMENSHFHYRDYRDNRSKIIHLDCGGGFPKVPDVCVA